MRRSRTADDRGFTLVELLVYMFLAVVVLTIISAILINSLRAENSVRAAALATDSAQLAAQSLNRGVHNSSAIEVSTPAAGVIVVRTRSLDSSSTGVWRCEAWSVIDNELRTTDSTTAIPAPSLASDVSNWLLLAEGVEPIGADPMFVLDADGRSLAVSLTVANGDGIPITLDTTIVSRQPTPATGRVTAPCF